MIPTVSDENGLLIHELEQQMKLHRPKLLFAAPTFSNPTGGVWNLGCRQDVLELCRRYGVLFVEDDSYGELDLNVKRGEIPPSLFALDDGGRGGQVLYIGSFSKTIAPALRIGWAAGAVPVIEGMTALKQLADMQSSTMNQRLLHHLLTGSGFSWHDHLALLNKEYATRLKLLLELLKRPLWKEVTWRMPDGGMYLWVRLPEGLDSAMLLKAALPKGVAFMPGRLCTVGKEGASYIRLNFSHPGRDELFMGMNLIGETIAEFTARS